MSINIYVNWIKFIIYRMRIECEQNKKKIAYTSKFCFFCCILNDYRFHMSISTQKIISLNLILHSSFYIFTLSQCNIFPHNIN